MKKKIPVCTLIEIENQIELSQKTGILSYTNLSKLMHDNYVSCDDLAKAIDLSLAMPYKEIVATIKDYDQSSISMDELKFVQSLVDKYNVSTKDVIKRIQCVRRIEKEIDRLSKIVSNN